MTATTGTCPVCSGACPDTFMCRKCAGDAARNAARVPELLAELATTVARASKQASAGLPTGHGHEKPSVVVWDAVVVRDDLVGTVRAWTSTPGARVADASWYRADPQGPDAADEIGFAVRATLAAIDRNPERRFVGRCSCGGALFARDGKAEATCPRCAAVLDADAGRVQLVEDVRDTLLTSAKLRAALSSWAGVEVKAPTLRAWVSRGRLTAQACEVATRHPQYRVADVLDLTNASRRADVIAS